MPIAKELKKGKGKRKISVYRIVYRFGLHVKY